jgi:hypothetical protein
MNDNLLSKINLLRQQIQKYNSLDDWWEKCIFTPVMRVFWPQIIVLALIEVVICHTGNWLAALLCLAIIVSKIYSTISLLGNNLMHGYLVQRLGNDITIPTIEKIQEP